MAILEKTIIVESRLQELFNYLPEMTSLKGNTTHKPIFKYGDEKALNTFLKLKKNETPPYPLIWLIYPYKEEHKRSKVLLNNISFVLALETNAVMLNDERIKITYEKGLIPLYNNIKHLFKFGNIINVKNHYYDIVKYPNYTGEPDDNKNQVGYIWDALKITFSGDISDSCLKPITF